VQRRVARGAAALDVVRLVAVKVIDLKAVAVGELLCDGGLPRAWRSTDPDDMSHRRQIVLCIINGL
jgi:hypothetical protein